MEQNKSKDAKAIKKLEEKKKKLMNEREKISKKDETAKEKDKAKHQKRLTEIDNELLEVNMKLDELLNAMPNDTTENTNAFENNDLVAFDESETQKASDTSLKKVNSSERPKVDFTDPEKSLEISILSKMCSTESKSSLKSQRICKHCHKPINPCPSHSNISTSTKKEPCSLVMSSKSGASITTLKSFEQSSLQKSCSQTSSLHKSPQQLSRCASKTQSRTCINCGGKIRDDMIPICNSKPQTISYKSLMSNQYNTDHNQEFPARSRSKCSQLSQNKSVKSFAPCQSFDQCSACNRILFSTCQSCASFDVCSKCKHSMEGSSRDLKARSVIFGGNDQSTTSLGSEKIIESFSCADAMKTLDFCGCASTLKCKDPCPIDTDNACNQGDDDDICAKLKKSLQDLETFVPKEPSQLSVMKQLIEERIATSQAELLSSTKKPSKIIRKFDPTKPRRHRMKKMGCEFDEFECPENPCVMTEEKKERMLKLMEKQVQRENKRQADMKAQKQARLQQILAEKCGDADECKTDEKCGTETNDDCAGYSKKYQKMKYEIELQNYLVEKLNRDLQLKISANFPASALNEMKCYLDKEVIKLREMVEFTIFEQCRNKDLKWGPIPISTLTSTKVPHFSVHHCVPKTPSGVSVISAFSMLDEIKLCQEKERCNQQLEIQCNRNKAITEMVRDIQSLECTLTQLKCEHEQLSKNLVNLDSNSTRNVPNNSKLKEFEDIKIRMDQIVADIKGTKNDIDNIHVKLHTVQN